LFEPSRTDQKGTQMTNHPLTIRRADLADLAALDRLAALDSASPPTGDALVAEVGGELWAALEIDTGATIADPFRPSGDLVELLKLHARGERERGERGALSRLLPRVA
jgi:hypothetical protein